MQLYICNSDELHQDQNRNKAFGLRFVPTPNPARDFAECDVHSFCLDREKCDYQSGLTFACKRTSDQHQTFNPQAGTLTPYTTDDEELLKLLIKQ